MVNYRAMNSTQLKEFINRENIKLGEPSAKYGRFIKNDYLVTIIKDLDSFPLQNIVPCEWLSIGSLNKWRMQSVRGDKYCYLHEWRIRCEKSISAPCKKCGVGTKTKSRLCDF